MRIHQLTVAEALSSVRSSAAGLSAEEALHRLREFGANRVQQVAREPLVLRLLKVSAEIWIFLIPFAVAMFLMEELRKWLARRGLH